MTIVSLSLSLFPAVNKHKPWIETTYHGIITENDDKVLLDPPLIALDKDAPLRYAGKRGGFTLLLPYHSFILICLVLPQIHIKIEIYIYSLSV